MAPLHRAFSKDTDDATESLTAIEERMKMIAQVSTIKLIISIVILILVNKFITLINRSK